MNKIYLLFGFGIVICGAYFYGANVADAKCRAKIAQENLEQIQHVRKQNIINKRTTHEIVYKTGMGDIRRILHDKYSIAE